MVAGPVITITYCTQCRWLLRSAWLAQELLTTFEVSLGGVTLVPASGGVFHIYVDDIMLWERKRDGGFPDIKIRNVLKSIKSDPALAKANLNALIKIALQKINQ